MIKDILNKIASIRLLGMHHAFQTSIENTQMENFTNDEPVGHLAQSEWNDRQHLTLQRVLKNANFLYKARIEQLDYTVDLMLD